ncbi:MAG: hypothetical protein AAF750_11905 [Planctomycetota bacterium]
MKIIACSLCLVSMIFCPGCLGSMIAFGGKDLTIDPGTTPRKLQRRFGKPVEVALYEPPTTLASIPSFRPWFSPEGHPLHGIEKLIDLERPITKTAVYRHKGAVRRDPGQVAGMEFAVNVMTLGLTQFHSIAWGIEERNKQRNRVREFIVAFDASGRSVATAKWQGSEPRQAGPD